MVGNYLTHVGHCKDMREFPIQATPRSSCIFYQLRNKGIVPTTAKKKYKIIGLMKKEYFLNKFNVILKHFRGKTLHSYFYTLFLYFYI